MLLYHGTSRTAWARIQTEGVEAPSYWGDLEQAQAYAASFGNDGLVLQADLEEADLQLSELMAASLLEEGDLEPDEVQAMQTAVDRNDLAFSLEHLGGVTCTAVVRHAECLASTPPARPRRRHP